MRAGRFSVHQSILSDQSIGLARQRENEREGERENEKKGEREREERVREE